MTLRDERNIYGYVARLCEKWTPDRIIGHLHEQRPLLRRMIYKFPFRLPPCVDEDDLCQEISTALLRARRSHDPMRGVLEKHLEWNVTREIRHWARTLNPLGRRRWEQTQQVSEAWPILAQRNHRLPSTNELAAETGIPAWMVERVLSAMEMRDVLPLDATVGDVDLPDPGVDPFDLAWHKDCLRRLGAALGELSPEERSLVGMHYGEGLTVRLVAQRLGISKSNAGRLHQQMLLRLRGLLTRGRPPAPRRPSRPAGPQPVPLLTRPYVDYERRPWSREQESSTWWARTTRAFRCWTRDLLLRVGFGDASPDGVYRMLT